MRDYPVVQGAVLLISAAFIVVNLLVDVLYSLIDPRIRYGLERRLEAAALGLLTRHLAGVVGGPAPFSS